MKKSVLVIVSMFVLSGVAFSSEINLNMGFGSGETKTNSTRTITISQKSKEMPTLISTTTEYAVDCAVERLFPLNDSFKLGAGLRWVSSITRGSDDSMWQSISYLPIYFTMQVNPISLAKGAFFVKGNLGYTWFFSSAKEMILIENRESNPPSITEKGGLYYALGVGYEYYENSVGITLDVTYSHYTSSSILRSETVGRQASFVFWRSSILLDAQIVKNALLKGIHF